jgi:hypothetical protein
MPVFNARDLRLIEDLGYNPDLEPSFDEIKGCLVWEDERPSGLTPEGYERLCDLWIIRGYIHREVSPHQWGIDPSSGYFQDLWKQAQTEQIKWSGFRRMKLSSKDRHYLNACLREQ